MKFRKRLGKLLGEILVERGVIAPEQLKEALEVQLKQGGLIGEIIVKLGFAKEEDIAQCISLQYGFPYLPLGNYEISEEILKIVPKNVAEHYCLVPIDKIGDTLTVVMSNPLNTEAIEDLEDLSSAEVQIFISTASDVRRAIQKFYK